jgi:hypothetical protein
MLKRDEENQRDEEDRIRRSIASQDDEINLGEEDREQAFSKKKKKQHKQASLFPNNTIT